MRSQSPGDRTWLERKRDPIHGPCGHRLPLRVATLNGAHCTWEGVDPATIRIRPTAKIEIPFLGTINFDFDFRIQKGGKAGVLELLGAPIPLQRDAGGSANT